MKHVSILIPKGDSSVVNIEGTYQMFSQVNEFMISRGRPSVFDIHLVGVDKKTEQANGLFAINTKSISEIKKTDLIIIPAIFNQPNTAEEKNQKLIPWVVQQHRNGAEVASFCIGAFFLAQTGLLDGKKCSTHWAEAANFRELFPHIKLVDDRIMTAEDGIYTSGGAYSYLNLLIYLIEQYAGREMAVLISKTFMIDIDKHSQSPFIIFRGQKEHEDDVVKKAQGYIEQHFRDKITVDLLCEKFALGRRTFERRFKKSTSNTIIEYIQRVRVEAAKKQLEKGYKTVGEVMYEVGYSDSKAFREVFKRIAGMSPVDYRNKYSQEAA